MLSLIHILNYFQYFIISCKSNDEYSYPFAGYYEILKIIYKTVCERKKDGYILDVGFGTGILTEKFYQNGYSVTGIDFSQQMIDTANLKMPDANLIQHDFSTGYPSALKEKTFDFIISTYAIPVSYTHLDVYKRQVYPRAIFAATLAIG